MPRKTFFVGPDVEGLGVASMRPRPDAAENFPPPAFPPTI